MKLFIALSLVLLTAGLARAQDGTAPVQTLTVIRSVHETSTESVMGGDVAASPFGDDSVQAVVKGEGQLTQRIVLVLDVSGSMKNENRIGRVLQVLKHVMGQPADDLEVAVITFSSGFDRWPGVPEPNAKPPVPYGWARLPSADAMSSAQVWVATRANNGTNPEGALRAAITEAREKTSVVLVTDGEFPGPSCVATVRSAQKERVNAGRGEASILVYGVGTGVAKCEHLATIGREGGCGFWIDKPKIEKVEPREPD
jgi:hypothetical protein